MLGLGLGLVLGLGLALRLGFGSGQFSVNANVPDVGLDDATLLLGLPRARVGLGSGDSTMDMTSAVSLGAHNTHIHGSSKSRLSSSTLAH